MSDITNQSLKEIIENIKSKKISSLDLTRSYIKNIEEENNIVDTDLSKVSEHSNEAGETNPSPSNGLENFDFDEETPELFNSDGSVNDTKEDTSSANIGIETQEDEEDELEIPAFLRRQKN